MSTAEIIKQLPKLTAEERRAIAKRLFELEQNREALETAAEAADTAFQKLDKLETKDAKSKILQD